MDEHLEAPAHVHVLAYRAEYQAEHGFWRVWAMLHNGIGLMSYTLPWDTGQFVAELLERHGGLSLIPQIVHRRRIETLEYGAVDVTSMHR